jgi:hypothetical protein
MRSFPDESTMERSEDGTEPIRGSSIGFNRILGNFVSWSNYDRKPKYTAFFISAFTIFRNVWTMHKSPTLQDIEEGFVRDVNLFLEYYDIYLSNVSSQLDRNKQAPVVIYFPDYRALPKEILRDSSDKNKAMLALYQKFSNLHGNHNGEVRRLELVRCFWVAVGGSTYPHKELASKFRDITNHRSSLYTTGDNICLISHIPLDYYITFRIRNISLLESYTGLIKSPKEFGKKLDKEGRIPFLPTTHVVFGDGVMIKQMVSLKIKRELLEQAEKEKWFTRSEEDIRFKIIVKLNLHSSFFKKFDFI